MATLRSISFEADLIAGCAERFLNFCEQHAIRPPPTLDVVMDLTFYHLERPLRLVDLLSSRDIDFIHDVQGIMNVIDRRNQKINGEIFTPRHIQ